MVNFQKELDRVKVSVFRGKNSAFYGSLLSKMEIKHVPDNEDSAVIDMNEMTVELSDKFFQLSPETQETTMVHELNHIARLHSLRQGNRSQKEWDQACDIEINNALARERYGFDGLTPNLNSDYVNLPAEDIYKLLMAEKDDDDDGDGDSGWGGDSHKNQNSPDDGSGQGNSSPTTDQILAQISAVEQASQQAKIAGQPMDMGTGSQAIEDILKSFKKPTVNWNVILRRFFTELVKSNYSFARPNRRHEDVYLPSLQDEEGKLTKINFYVDRSGSVSENESKTFLSEFAHIKNTFNPDELNMIQFDTQILREDSFKSSQRIKEINFVWGGGTCLHPVHQHILDTKPKVVIIMSDLYVNPMPEIKGVDIIWLCVNNPNAVVNQGKVIHINVDN